jgi:serine racemase
MYAMQLVVEPSGAVGLAAVLSEQFGAHPRLQGCRRVGVILCGGNVDVGARMLNVLVAQTTKPAA